QRTGAAELLAGQARDLAAQPGRGGAGAPRWPADFEALEAVHRGKTGALFAAACELGAIAADGDADARRRLADLGLALGVAFQHADDLDDGEAPAHAARARARRAELGAEAEAIARGLGARGARLAGLARWVAGDG